MIKGNKARAQQFGLAIGTRTHVDIVEISDIMCNINPVSYYANFDINYAVYELSFFYYGLKNRFTTSNPQIKVVIGESGWPSQGILPNGRPASVSNLVNYWKSLGNWASLYKVPLYFFEAIDEPWKEDFDKSQAHLGWLVRDGDNFIEKAHSFLL
ncbi:hypothetical protein B4U79_18017 [Dinothrombium tinctorium]|uniref:glucan endo-1,3-beta-D-glucosidase n=1 Tax=Dinothrombium tinctorium TaxID=1965070 RepID=A0A3S3PLH1_9ACAR|nr:hypothetical protein B4U79_18017 [Dinothrombium tinctorium]